VPFQHWNPSFHWLPPLQEYTVLPFRLVNTPAIFQALMNKVIGGFLDHGVVVYLDAILIYSESEEVYIKWVKNVLAKLEEHLLAVLVIRSVSHVESVKHLGYIGGIDGVTMGERKVESVMHWKVPWSVKKVKIVIGFVNLSQWFIKDFSNICRHTKLTLKANKTKFNWGPKQDEVFTEVKRRFVRVPILAHFYPDREMVVETDASAFALGCLLS